MFGTDCSMQVEILCRNFVPDINALPCRDSPFVVDNNAGGGFGEAPSERLTGKRSCPRNPVKIFYHDLVEAVASCSV